LFPPFAISFAILTGLFLATLTNTRQQLGEPLTSLAVPILVLVAFGIAFFAIARRMARRWEMA